MVTISAAIDSLIGTLDLGATGEAHAAIARTLAARLDATGEDDTGAQTAALAKELRASIGMLTDLNGEAAALVAGLFEE